MVEVKFKGLTPKGNKVYEIPTLELEVIEVPKKIYFESNPYDKDIIDEKEQYKIETLTKKLLAVWHTPQEVAEYYLQKHRAGKTTEALLAGLKSDLNQREQQLKDADDTINSMGGNINSALKNANKAEEIIIDIKDTWGEQVFYQNSNIRITESNLRDIFDEYFKGTSLDNISYQWGEILDSNYLIHINSFLDKKASIIDKTNSFINLSNQLKFSLNSISETNKKKYLRALKETKIKIWVLKKAVNYKHLQKALENNPKRIAYNYKIDNGEEIAWIYEVTEIFNEKFGSNWSPVGVFSFIVGGLLGIVFFGYWFFSRVKSLLINRNNSK
ncbi:hypothetical protein [endosymbiont GvMRE of Glomus versiforme]|uniref:hypothetical protein n=1 Tax=endosymbiont GvMRE of Glomus versiforme TaxID=2039283 RepID=UPI000EF06E65|nr:hypothetical protein [endosymbiont GvMRE of Glomus versiforme]RHZ35515.1 hypothetical protein GvMRE_IIg217 [endosymbiont GvMRE of Glomus versiforme]